MYNEDKREISCRTINSVLEYTRRQGKGIALLIEGLPFDEAYLTDTNNWVSLEVEKEIFARFKKMFDDEDILYKVGYAAEELHTLGFIDYIARLMGDPQLTVRRLPELNKYFNRIYEIETIKFGPGGAVLVNRARPGYKITKDNCLFTKGLLAAVPNIWRIGPAKIWEEVCVRQGADHCIYKIRWSPIKMLYRWTLYVLFHRPKVLSKAVEEVFKENDLIQKKYEELYEKNLLLQRHYVDTISTLVRAIDAKDHYTEDHSINVSRLAEDIAEELKLPPEKIRTIRTACRLHDLGKIGIRDSILLKAASLTEEEWEEMKKHPVLGAKIIRPLAFLREVAMLIRQDHERWDGKGYPDGLKAEEIDMGARVIMVADAYDAMTSGRPYRKAMNEQDAIEEIKRNSGTQFDPKVAEAFLKVMSARPASNS